MRTLVLALAAAALFVVPSASASVSYNGVLPATTPLQGIPMPYSTPVLQSSHFYGITAGPGDTISATLTWTDTATGAPVGNDLDLTLQKPSAGPQPVNILDPVGTATGVVAVRVARQTCTDAVAESNNHAALGNPQGVEGLSIAIPAGGESGTYALLVRGFVLTFDQPYALTITVTNSGGTDVTASRIGPAIPGLPPGGYSTFITTNPYCQIL